MANTVSGIRHNCSVMAARLKARMGRNPATGAAIKIAAKKLVKFRVATSAKDAIVPPKFKKAKA
jgi:nucleoid DNA-binding protein